MSAWGFWTLDPERDGPRLELVAHAAATQPRGTPARRALRAAKAAQAAAGSGPRPRASLSERRLRAVER